MNESGNFRASRICGSMNSMYYVQQSKILQNRFIRMGESYYRGSANISKNYLDETFSTQIQISSFTAWLLLFVSVLFSAFVPCWLLADVKSQVLTRNSWRYFTVSILLIPFLCYEQRNLKSQNQKFLKQLTSEKLKPIFLGSMNFCIWLLCLIYACKFTSMNHALCLSYLRFFFISGIKILKKQKIHQFQIAGSILCSIGVILVMSDSITLPQMFGPALQNYKSVQPWKRLFLGDGLALFASLVSVYLDQHFTIPQLPRFTYLYLYNLFLSINLLTFGFFFGGSQFSFNTKFGIFGLFTYQNFVNVFYVSIMLGFYLMIANILISQVFNQVIINAGASFQLIITSIAWHLLGLELMPANMTCLGYAFITPGLIFVIGGQGALSNVGHQMNLQLYRPTQINNTQLLYSKNNEFSDDSQNIKQADDEKLPFEMILEEQDQIDGKILKNQ